MRDTVSGFLMMLVPVALSIGWILNVVALIQDGSRMETWEVVVRVVGAVLAPLGSLMGLLWW